MTAGAKAHGAPDFESVLLAIAGHDLRQPLQIIQSVHELLGLGLRTNPELRLLRSGQNAIDRLRELLDQLLTALRLREHAKEAELKPVQLGTLLRQGRRENEEAALWKGIGIRVAPTTTSILAEYTLLSAVLRNLVSNAVQYTTLRIDRSFVISEARDYAFFGRLRLFLRSSC